MIKPNPFPETTLIHDKSRFEDISKGKWSSTSEDPSWKSGYRRYGAAKLCAMMMVHELQRRMNTDPLLKNISILAVDPGFMSTGLQRDGPWYVRLLVFNVLFPIGVWLMPNGPIRSPDTSAGHVLRAAFEEGLGGDGGTKGLYFDGVVPAETSGESRDGGKRELVWKESVRLTGLRDGETALEDWR